MLIYFVSNREEVSCPFCGKPSSKVHSHYMRSFQDLPIQGRKVVVILNNRKLFCHNSECKNVSSIAAAQILHNSVANVGKSTICNLLKKIHIDYREK